MSHESLSVLFVDDEPRILDGLRRQLRDHRKQWQMRFAVGGFEALKALELEPADIVIADMRMPQMSGGELLKRVRERHPGTTRIIFSGQTDEIDLFSNLGSVHHYLQKPCDAAVLCRAIERTYDLGRNLKSPRMRIAVNRLSALPPENEVYRELRAELSRDQADIIRIAKLISRDPALTAKVLQLVSSAFFGLPRRVVDPHDAVVLLGINTIHAIVITGHLFDFIERDLVHQREINHLWKASVMTGELAARLALEVDAHRETQKIARVAGMLSLIGRAVLVTSESTPYAEVALLAARDQISLADAEREMFGATHMELGGYALGLWGLPEPVVNAAVGRANTDLSAHSAIDDVCQFVYRARRSLGGGIRTLDEKPALDPSMEESPEVECAIDHRRKSA